jgi:putative multiple sugar transport system ATP-binding protein
LGTTYLLEMHNITKEFPGVLALDKVHLLVEENEIHAVVGENGAGKSTLMNVLSGVYPHGTYDGEIIFNGSPYQVRGIRQSENTGIAIIHQEFTLMPNLSVAENMFLGSEKSRRGVVNWHETKKKAEQLAHSVGLDVNTDVLVKDIGVGQRQLVEIAKALSKNITLLILDEPTAALNEIESKNLLKLLLKLKKDGLTSVLISHKLNEVLEISDSITILRDGKTIERLNVSQDKVTEARIVKGMVGREMVNRYPKRESVIGDKLFEVKNWKAEHPTIPGKYIADDISIYIREGEVVGLAGLMGAGRTEFSMNLFGRSYGTYDSGEAYLRGKQIEVKSVWQAIKSGLAYISEDRKGLGLILKNSVKDNVTLANLPAVSKNLVINRNEEIVVTERAVKDFNIKCPNILQHVLNLSGGNQQKVVLAKWLYCDSDVYILDEPTRGIDVGAKYDVHTFVNNLAAQGKGILFISSELPEVIGVCDRIYVMSEGRIVGELTREEADQERIMHMLV